MRGGGGRGSSPVTSWGPTTFLCANPNTHHRPSLDGDLQGVVRKERGSSLWPFFPANSLLGARFCPGEGTLVWIHETEGEPPRPFSVAMLTRTNRSGYRTHLGTAHGFRRDAREPLLQQRLWCLRRTSPVRNLGRRTKQADGKDACSASQPENGRNKKKQDVSCTVSQWLGSTLGFRSENGE